MFFTYLKVLQLLTELYFFRIETKDYIFFLLQTLEWKVAPIPSYPYLASEKAQIKYVLTLEIEKIWRVIMWLPSRPEVNKRNCPLWMVRHK